MSTGLGRATRNLLPRVAVLGYACAFVGWGEGNACDLSNQPYNTFSFPAPTSLQDAVGYGIREFDPEIVATFIDNWWVDWFPFIPERANRRWLLYMNCDGSPLYRGWIPTIQAADVVATTACFGRTIVEDAIPERNVRVIPHGVDSMMYRPMPDVRLPELKDRFVVGCIARNMVRKQIPLLIRAFAEFRLHAPDAILYLHMNPHDPEGWDLPDLIRRFGIGDFTIIPDELSVSRGISDEAMAGVYAQFDVFALPTMGEGFGLPLLEAMACGVPVIATDCSAVTELVHDVGLLIRPAATVTGSYNVDQVVADVDHFVSLLLKVYHDSALRERMSEAGLAKAASMTWEGAADALVTEITA